MISPELRILLAFLVSFFSALFVIPKIASIARTIGLLDHPGTRKIHTEPRPLVGGIGMVISATFSCLLLVPLAGFRGLFLGLAVLLLVGFFDDFRELGHRQKFLAQIGASILAMYFCKTYLISFGDLIGRGPLTLPNNNGIIWLVTIFCIVGVINAVNLVDGMDGLAGGVAFIAFFVFALHASFAGESVLMLLNLAFAGAVLGFLRYNWYPASVFMGDAGSLCLGFVLAFMSILMTQGDRAVMSPVCALLILAVPITDTVIVMTKRIVRGQSPFKADQYHMHHIFLRFGLDKNVAVKIILLVSALLGGFTLLEPGYSIPEYALFGIYVGYFLVYFISSFFIVFTMRASLKYQRRKRKDDLDRPKNKFDGMLFGKIKLFKKLRRDTRYEVKLDIVCFDKGKEKRYSGMLRNLSGTGCMAVIPDLSELKEDVVIEISFPMNDGVHMIPIPATHLWIMENENSFDHGFQFRHLSDELQSIYMSFVVKLNRQRSS